MEEKKKVVRYKLVRHKWPDEIAAEKAKRTHRIMTAAFCVVCFVIGFLSSMLLDKNSITANEDAKKLQTIYEVMHDKWYFGKDKKKLSSTLYNGAITGMVDSGKDPHTVYMDAQQANDFTSSLQGSFVGIGIQYYSDGHMGIVSRVFKGSPAEEAGMIENDHIVKVAGKSVEGMTADEISEIVKGKAGTKVKISVLRENKEVTLNVERRKVESSVVGYVKEGQIGVLEVTSFAETTGSEVGKYLESFKQQGVKKLIVDFRNNSGGYLTAAQQMASYFTPQNKTLFIEETKDGTRTKYKTLEKYPLYRYDQIAVLVNNDTASAAEVLTGFLKEQVNAKVVGETTYGKGTAQVTQSFDDGSVLKYTTSQWFTSKGKKVNGVGIKPDYVVSLDPALSIGLSRDIKKEEFKVDSVSEACVAAQYYLKFIGYDVDRTDGYFSVKTEQALRQYQQDKGLEVTGVINKKVILSLNSSASIYWHEHNDTLDTQMIKAVDVVHGK